MAVTIREIRDAQQRISAYVNNTPIVTSSTLNDVLNASCFFKCENFQKVGAFKFRGACNTVMSMDSKNAAYGVVTHSSGNHAAALSLAAKMMGIPAYIVMPSNSPVVKVEAVRSYGGIITFCEPTLQARETTAAKILEQTGAHMIHPYNNEQIIAGQGTAMLELLSACPDLDVVLAPVGGGGLLSGTAIAAKSILADSHVVGCEPANADDAYRSFQAGHIIPSDNPNTIADGLKTSLGDITFPIIKQFVDEIVLISENEIVDAMQFAYERMKIIIEPSSAVPLAALLYKKVHVENKQVGVILSGGNVDMRGWFNEFKSTT